MSMTAERAAYFLRRFKHDEKMLGPNEQAALDFAIAVLAAQRQAEPVAYQYQDREGKWRPFMDERHYENTVADGSWPIRALYAGPVPAAGDEVTDALPMVPRSVAQRAVNHASLGTPGSLSDATKMLDAAMQKDTQ
jgi:hypothetical protein